MPDDEAILVYLNLLKLEFYYGGSQSTLVENLFELEKKIKLTAPLATVIPMATALNVLVRDAFAEKEEQFGVIETDRSDVLPLIYTARTCFLTCFGDLHGINSANLSKISDLLPMDIMYRDQRSKNFLYKNQAAIKSPLSAMVNIPRPTFTYSQVIIVENMGPNALKLFTSLLFATESPEDAIIVAGNTKMEIKIADLGSKRAKYLMMEFLGSLELVNVKITIRNAK